MMRVIARGTLYAFLYLSVLIGACWLMWTLTGVASFASDAKDSVRSDAGKYSIELGPTEFVLGATGSRKVVAVVLAILLLVSESRGLRGARLPTVAALVAVVSELAIRRVFFAQALQLYPPELVLRAAASYLVPPLLAGLAIGVCVARRSSGGRSPTASPGWRTESRAPAYTAGTLGLALACLGWFGRSTRIGGLDNSVEFLLVPGYQLGSLLARFLYGSELWVGAVLGLTWIFYSLVVYGVYEDLRFAGQVDEGVSSS